MGKHVRKSATERFAALFARIPSMVWSILRDAMNPDRADYVPEVHKVAEGLVRARRDCKRFTFYANPDAVRARVEKLRERIARIETVASKVQNGELVRADAVRSADSAFEKMGAEIRNSLLAGSEPDVRGIFNIAFPSDVRKVLSDYAETPDPFAGTEDSVDAEDSDDDSAD